MVNDAAMATKSDKTEFIFMMVESNRCNDEHKRRFGVVQVLFFYEYLNVNIGLFRVRA